MSKTTWIILGIILAFSGGLIWYLVSNNNSTIDYSDLDLNRPIPADERNGHIGDHVFGDPNAPIIIVNYGDFQCPACSAAAPRIKAIVASYEPGQVALIHRNFPIPSLHPNARAAAAAAEAASFQGKFWEMHDILYQNQRSWGPANMTERDKLFNQYAEAIGLDLDQFAYDLRRPAINQRITFDLTIARSKGVSGTPTFFINGAQVAPQDATTDERLRDLIDQALRAATN